MPGVLIYNSLLRPGLLNPILFVLVGFVVAALALLTIALVNGSGNATEAALNGFRAAVQVLAGGLVSVVSHYLGRKGEQLHCPQCGADFSDSKQYMEHTCSRPVDTINQTPQPKE